MTTIVPPWTLTPAERREAEKAMGMPEGFLDGPRYQGPVEKFNPDQARVPAGNPDGGQWTSTGIGGATGAQAAASVTPLTKQAEDGLKDDQRGKSVEELHAMAVENQAKLRELGKDVSSRLGIDFKEGPNGGVKTLSGAIEKIGRKGYDGPHELTDLSRATFIVDRPGQAHDLVLALGQRAKVFDQGWYAQPGTGYMDRKLLLQFPNKGIAEVQVIPRGMYEAKKGGGHHLYTLARDPATPKGQALLFAETQRAIYESSVRNTEFASLGK